MPTGDVQEGTWETKGNQADARGSVWNQDWTEAHAWFFTGSFPGAGIPTKGGRRAGAPPLQTDLVRAK